MRYIVRVKLPSYGWGERTFENYDAALDHLLWLDSAGYVTEFSWYRVFDF